MIVYFIGYNSTPTETTAVQIFGHPLAYLKYFLAYIGGPIAPFAGSASTLTGLFGIGYAAYLVNGIQRQSLHDSIPTRFALSLMLVAFGCAFLTGLKQWPEGVNQAINSRYHAWATLFWVALLILNATHARSARIAKNVRPCSPTPWNLTCCTCIPRWTCRKK
jgi:hypothetical protein